MHNTHTTHNSRQTQFAQTISIRRHSFKMNFQDELNTTFIAEEDSDFLEELEFVRLLNQSCTRTSTISSQMIFKMNIQDELNTAFIVDDNEFLQELEFSLNGSAEDMPR